MDGIGGAAARAVIVNTVAYITADSPNDRFFVFHFQNLLCEVIVCRIDRNTVSYTHLDVYKRQMKIITEGMIKENQPKFEVGDTVRVSVRIKEGERERIQAFEGTVIAKKHGGVAETFTVRRSSYGVGVERVFPVNSPFVEKVEVVRRGKVRRAKLFYLRSRTGKAAKVKEQI